MHLEKESELHVVVEFVQASILPGLSMPRIPRASKEYNNDKQSCDTGSARILIRTRCGESLRNHTFMYNHSDQNRLNLAPDEHEPPKTPNPYTRLSIILQVPALFILGTVLRAAYHPQRSEPTRTREGSV